MLPRPRSPITKALTGLAAGLIALALAKGPRGASARSVLTATSADSQHVTIKVTGMFCESCEAAVHAMLKRTRGV